MQFYERLFGTGTRRGVASMTLSMMLFIVNDSLVKVVSASLGAGQLIAIRGLIASLIVLALIAGTGAGPPQRR
ncbi:MAG: hypothetical protein ACT60Q_18570, partial [Ferrovibrionaceae bacterium]